MKGYISTDKYLSALAELQQRLEEGKMDECEKIVNDMILSANEEQDEITKEYLDKLTERKKATRIADINRMLTEMSMKQVENVHKYTSDEYDEPNHEAEALDVIMNLSHRKRMDA